ncbi:hypothetical protein PISMIDRAFT_537674 [Pisolithus microcarpus 441]|uniref:Zinc finger ZPR1-type domain-containing protein n=1 Tax=Pisolithus microcarpus 441 TaxID=765257 RepID=A0A0C9ZPD6_9AGAM|nr:hypothetical protein PISMIDRAFT_537674 [Pisolithus microcarpus 441]
MSNSLEAYRTLVDVQDACEQNRVLVLLPLEEYSTGREGTSEETTEADGKGAGDTNEKFMGVCSRYAHPLIVRMRNVSIPYFQDTLIMSTNCERCGYRDNEVAVRKGICGRGLQYDGGRRPTKVPRRLEAVRREITNAEKPFPLILDDPLAHSYSYVPDRNPNMEIVTFERNWQPNEEPGLNDMKVGNYIAEDPKEVKRFEEVTS